MRTMWVAQKIGMSVKSVCMYKDKVGNIRSSLGKDLLEKA